MTEHSKIPLPKDESDKASAQDSSLFERASGAFGFSPFTPSPVSRKLPDREMKRAKVRTRQEPEPKPETAVSGAPKAGGGSLAAPQPTNHLPVPAAPRELVVEQNVGAVALSGQKHPVDRDHLREQGLIVPEGTTTALLEEFRIIKRRVLKAAKDRGTAQARRLLVCSPHPGEGKTFCASNLAIAMAAERDSEVLLIDGDFAKPSILSTFGLPRGAGFMDCLADDNVQPEDLVMGTDIPGLWILPTGNQTYSDSEYLSSKRTAEVLDRLTMGAPDRMVIFDSPPALSASPAAELAKHVGQALLVARADKTGQSALEDACQLLSACPDIKLLLNAAQFSPSGRNFGSYYGYGD